MTANNESLDTPEKVLEFAMRALPQPPLRPLCRVGGNHYQKHDLDIHGVCERCGESFKLTIR